MKIYTYYQEIGKCHEQELIDLWKISWSRQGYEPIVLNLQDAKKHPYFKTFNTEMRKIFKEITNKEIGDYGMSCYVRWLAYATQNEEKFYVSDYDAININFPITEPTEKLHLLTGQCPFLASGTPKQFENLCKVFVKVSKERLKILQKQADHYHDQEFFKHNFNKKFNVDCENYLTEYEIQFDLVHKKFADYKTNLSLSLFKNKDAEVVHVSNRVTTELRNEFENKNGIKQESLQIRQGKFRLELVKKLLEI
tara:strand:- start:452 stop:1207 length:756 start_codon:yes stop_codon:yes gene_type:complete